MILCITILKYLSVLEDPAWNREEVRNTVDLITTIDCMIQKLDLVAIEANLQCDDSLFNLLSKLLSKCRVWAGTRLNMASQMQAPCETSNSSNIPDLDQMIWMQSMDLENDQWFEEAMNFPRPLF